MLQKLRRRVKIFFLKRKERHIKNIVNEIYEEILEFFSDVF